MSNVNDAFDFSASRLMLTRRDLLMYEDLLCRDLKEVISFESHALYFPVEDELKKFVYIAEEEKLLLPLRYQNALLAVLLLKGVKIRENEANMLSSFVHVCLEKIHLYKKEQIDERCGLLRPRFFMERLEKEIRSINAYFQNTLQHDTQKQDGEIPLAGFAADFAPSFPLSESGFGFQEISGPQARQSSVGLMVLPVLGLNFLRTAMGFHYAEKVYARLAEKIRASIPSDAYCTLLDDDNFAILFPGATRKMMDNLAHDCLSIEEKIAVENYRKPFLKEKEAVLKFCAGYALFPQDWDGTADSRDVEEVPYLLVHKAKLTAKRLQEATETQKAVGSMQSLAYKQILLHGGSVSAVKPYAQLEVDLGRDSGAYEGMCFRVGAGEDSFKGEIVLRKVYKNSAEAEVLLLDNPTQNISVGDRLFYVAESSFVSAELDKKTPFYAYRDFVNAVNEDIAKEQAPEYSLCLMLFHWANGRDDGEGEARQEENFSVKNIALALSQYLQKNGQKKNVYAEVPKFGSLSFNSILIYHKNAKTEDLRPLYAEALAYLEKKFRLIGAVGLCTYPFLTYTPAEMWEGVRKALNYALLLPAPHIGVLNSLAINISADRKFSLGDTFGAVEEYRMALLADTDNILAWNSLGVCLADLGRHAEAKHAFEVAYSKNSKDFTTCYNLGTTCIALEDRKGAKEFFLASLGIKPDHVFARIRLGEIAEKEKDFESAKEQYMLALEANPQSSVPYRCLAKLFMQEENFEKAREYLQSALQRNSEDAVSLQLLAGLYLDSNEDAGLAEMLARQSIALLPYRRAAWGELARALEAQGKKNEAIEIRRNSMRL